MTCVGKRETEGELGPYQKRTTRTGCFRVSASKNPEPAQKFTTPQYYHINLHIDCFTVRCPSSK